MSSTITVYHFTEDLLKDHLATKQYYTQKNIFLYWLKYNLKIAYWQTLDWGRREGEEGRGDGEKGGRMGGEIGGEFTVTREQEAIMTYQY